jgi:hypothetical protein
LRLDGLGVAKAARLTEECRPSYVEENNKAMLDFCISMGGVDSIAAVAPRGDTIGLRDRKSNINQHGTLSMSVAGGNCETVDISSADGLKGMGITGGDTPVVLLQ